MKLRLNNFRSLVLTAAILPLFLAAAFPVGVSAQSLTFAYAQTTLPLPGNQTPPTAPNAVGVDNGGNVYFSTNSGYLLKVQAGGGLPVEIASYPSGAIFSIAVDAAGNVFYIVGQYVGGQVLKVPAGGGTPTPVGTGISTPSGLAIDKQQNLYIADSAGTVWKIASDGTGVQTTVPVTGIANPEAVALDAAGDIYVAGNAMLVELPANGGSQIAIPTGLNPARDFIYGLAVDGPGNIYVSLEFAGQTASQQPFFEVVELPSATTSGMSIREGRPIYPGQLVADSQGSIDIVTPTVTPGSQIQELLRTNPVNLANVNVCGAGQTQPAPCSEAATLVYQVTASGTFGGANVMTKGSTNDFQQPSTSTCYGQLSAGQTCGVGVTFSPSVPNAQSGTVQILDGSSNVISTTGIKGYGIGSTPLLSGQPAGQTRNNYSGFVGFQFTVGAAPVEIFSLGRFVVSGNTGTHLVKLVQANGADVPGGAAMVATGFAASGGYAYASLNSPVTLTAGASYYLVSQETAGGDQWYDLGPVTSTSDATIVGPTYTDGSSRYVTVGGLPGNAYVPVNFQYSSAATTTPISVSITSPLPGATLSGVAAVTVSTTGPITSLQIQVNGVNQGSAFPPNAALSFDTTLLANGPNNALTVVASDAQSHTVTSSPVSVTIFNQAGGVTPFVTSQGAGSLRNNYSGFVGFAMTVGNSPIVVSQLGRYVALGNTGKHLLKLVNSNGTDVPGGSTLVPLDGSAAGGFSYSLLANPITLQANTTYLLVSQEIAGGDQWYDLAPVVTTSVATVNDPVYTDGGGNYIQVTSYPGDSYVPLSFLYATTATPLSVAITSPQAGFGVSGSSVPVVVSTTGAVSSLQLQVDGVNQGSPVASGPLTFNTTIVGNGNHTLTVVVTGNGGATAVSPGVIVGVSNGGVPATPFVTGETPSTLRNNYSGLVGMQIQVGATPLMVTALGRIFVATSNSAHTVKLVQANGTDLPGGSVSVSAMGASGGQFVYVALPSPVTLLAGTTYYLVSQETAGGDSWYDLEPVTGTGAAQILGPTYTDGHGAYVTVPGQAGYSYVPVSFEYQ